MAHADVATILEITDAAVKANLSLARKEMRLRLKDITKHVRSPNERTTMTQNNDCNNLDAYITDDLSIDDVRRFELHLEECSALREATDEQTGSTVYCNHPCNSDRTRACRDARFIPLILSPAPPRLTAACRLSGRRGTRRRRRLAGVLTASETSIDSSSGRGRR